jgi:PAS domain S-box-containing protein
LKNTGKITNQILTVVDSNNERAYIMFSSSLVKLDNVPCALTVSINITQQIVAEQKLKESEERYRLMAENTADTIMLMDMDMRFTYVSPSVLNLRGISAENVLKQSIHEIMPPESAHKLMRTFFEIQRIAKMDTPNSPKVYNLELEQFKFDGSTIWTELSLTLIRDEEYQPISILMVTRDISSRKFAEDEVIKLNKELELKVEERTLELKKTLEQLQESNYELNLLNSQVIEDSRRIIYLNEDLMNSQELLNQAIASKDRFFSIIAHDLRNPFVVLINNSDMLINHYYKMDDEKKLVMIKRISEASKFNYSLLENLLEWSRNQMGNIQYNPSMVNLSEIVSKTTNILQSFAMNKNITMNININNEYFAHCDSDILNTVLRNLISNAIKFSNENSSIEIKAQVYVQNTDFIKISIKDNGVGMSDEQIKNLFKLESNKSSVGTKNEKGSGLGLILCHDFVTMNKGHIWVESEENKGSTFFFTIPKAH